jgi:hypothetical protein
MLHSTSCPFVGSMTAIRAMIPPQKQHSNMPIYFFATLLNIRTIELGQASRP